MFTKICKKCGVEKSEVEFNWQKKSENLRHPYCKDCSKNSHNASYQKHKQKQIDRVNLRNKNVKSENRNKMVEYLKDHPCVDCGESDLVVLQFDHVKGKKEETISHMIHRAYCWNTILKEIRKCEVRCANCHQRKTAKQFNWTNRICQ